MYGDTAAVVTAWALLDPEGLLRMLLAMGVMMLVPGAILGAGFFAFKRVKKRKGRVGRPTRAVLGAVGTIKLASHYAIAKKKGICPFITFEQQASSSA
jgi:hypothetical protein